MATAWQAWVVSGVSLVSCPLRPALRSSDSTVSPDEVDGAGPREGGAEAGVDLGIVAAGAVLVVALRRVLHEIGGGRMEQTAAVQHSRQRAHRECAPAEAEQEHPVAVLVDLHEEAVGVLDVLAQAVASGLVHGGAQGAAVLLVHPPAGPDARVVVAALPLALLRQLAGGDHVGVVGAVLVSGAVAADDDVLHEAPSAPIKACGAFESAGSMPAAGLSIPDGCRVCVVADASLRTRPRGVERDRAASSL